MSKDGKVLDEAKIDVTKKPDKKEKEKKKKVKKKNKIKKANKKARNYVICNYRNWWQTIQSFG